MTGAKPLTGRLERIAVLRALPGLGDLLCAVPALRALRAAHPEAEVTLIGLPAITGLVERFGGYVDELVAFPGFPGIPEVALDPPRTVAFLAETQRRPFDLAIQMHGSGVATNPFVALLGARRTAGLFLPGLPAPDPELFVPYPGDAPEPLRALALMASLGFPADDSALEFPIRAADEAAWRQLAAGHGLGSGGYACVHAGAAEDRRRWPAERFAAVADALAARGLTIVLTGGPRERALTARVARAMRASVVDLAGETKLGALAALLRGARLTVTNDTGTSHLAAALGAPSVVVFSASDPGRWAPLDRRRHRALGELDRRRRPGASELTDVGVGEVVAACDALLAGPATASARRPRGSSSGEGPTVVGINRTQDASIAVARGPTRLASLQKERLTRRKHHWGRLGDVRDLYLPSLPDLGEPVDLVVECYSSDREIEHLPAYRDELEQSLHFRNGARTALVSHHLAHVYSAFHPSPFDRAAVMVVDAQGSAVRDVVEPFPRDGDGAPDRLEVASLYRCDRARGEVQCIAKQVWDGDWSRPVGLGCFYYLLTRVIFPTGEGNEGKVMGLAPFGRADALAMPDLVVDEHRVLIPGAWLELLDQAERFRFPSDGASVTDSANLAAAGQAAFETALLRLASWLAEQTGEANLCFAGGAALNCSANGRLLRESRFRELFIPPSPHDGGTAIGCALYGLITQLQAPSEFRWANDFLGPRPDEAALERELRAGAGDDLGVERPADLLDALVELLDRGGTVALHHGRSESGPRALGNRSILADARHPGMQDFINSRVKGREWFRPLAPIVLADAAAEVFDVDRPAPFMQIAADVRPEFRAALPAITHVDGTARLQTVDEQNTPFLHALLTRFRARTGCPVLLNTSLNGPGAPLTETAADSLATLRATDLHALALPPLLVRKRTPPPVAGDPPPR